MQVLAMPPEHHESHGSGYNQHAWISSMAATYGHAGQSGQALSPMHEYPRFDYHTPQSGSLPAEPAYRIARPAPYTGSASQMPTPLIVPQNVMWPSIIAAGGHQSYQPMILPAAPVSTPLSAPIGTDHTPTSAKATSRRKLTDDERRQMCLEAEQNPNMKQTQIGAKFNVERSTVSKILRQKEKYMNLAATDEVVSPGKKAKAKLPDFEKTLANWVRKQQRKGTTVTDEDLRRQAVVLSFSRSDQMLVSSPSWLEKFKQKNQLGHYVDSATHPSPLGSPASSTDLCLPAAPLDELSFPNGEVGEEDFDFEDRHSGHDDIDSVLDPTSKAFLDDGDALTDLPALHTFDHVSSNMHRQRSQTLSHLDDYAGAGTRSNAGYGDSKPPMSRALTTALTTTSHIDPMMTVKRHKSVPDIHDDLGAGNDIHLSTMQPPPLPGHSSSVSPISNPISPAEDDNIKALHHIKKLLEENPGVADPDDYLAIGKLMEKMKLLRSPTPSTISLGSVDVKGRKRQFRGIST